ncbi:MAG: heparan-alpha-glucosaminide N-acetyltransferase [Tissierellia bacterium]|nr:heparan-alpha-glucosaminide N-acetyltransferase [Tissierellia bacterium]
MNENKNRYELIDALRGLTIISMALYHFMYDLKIINLGDYSWVTNPFVSFWQRSILISFIFISGISWNFSKRPLKNGILLTVLGLIITFITTKFIPQERIVWGVLNFFGAAYLLMIIFDKLFKKIDMRFVFIISFIMIFYFPKLDFLKDYSFGFIFGATNNNFYSADYVPILPWIFIFIMGYAFWNIFKEKEKFNKIMEIRIGFLSSIGKNSLIIYLLHQPILYLIAKLIAR